MDSSINILHVSRSVGFERLEARSYHPTAAAFLESRHWTAFMRDGTRVGAAACV